MRDQAFLIAQLEKREREREKSKREGESFSSLDVQGNLKCPCVISIGTPHT